MVIKKRVDGSIHRPLLLSNDRDRVIPTVNTHEGFIPAMFQLVALSIATRFFINCNLTPREINKPAGLLRVVIIFSSHWIFN